jgi:hypothetical protein
LAGEQFRWNVNGFRPKVVCVAANVARAPRQTVGGSTPFTALPKNSIASAATTIHQP